MFKRERVFINIRNEMIFVHDASYINSKNWRNGTYCATLYVDGVNVVKINAHMPRRDKISIVYYAVVNNESTNLPFNITPLVQREVAKLIN